VGEKRTSEVSIKALTGPRFPGLQNSLETGSLNTKILGLTQTDLNYGFPLARPEPKQFPIRYSPQTLSVSMLTPSPKEICRKLRKQVGLSFLAAERPIMDDRLASYGDLERLQCQSSGSILS
jgi:hypothetical protein